MGEGETSEQASFKQPNTFFLWSASWNSPIYFCFDQLHETSHCIISCLLLWDLNLSDDDFDKVPSYLPCSSSHTKLKENKLLSDFFLIKVLPVKYLISLCLILCLIIWGLLIASYWILNYLFGSSVILSLSGSKRIHGGWTCIKLSVEIMVERISLKND